MRSYEWIMGLSWGVPLFPCSPEILTLCSLVPPYFFLLFPIWSKCYVPLFPIQNGQCSPFKIVCVPLCPYPCLLLWTKIGEIMPSEARLKIFLVSPSPKLINSLLRAWKWSILPRIRTMNSHVPLFPASWVMFPCSLTFSCLCSPVPFHFFGFVPLFPQTPVRAPITILRYEKFNKIAPHWYLIGVRVKFEF